MNKDQFSCPQASESLLQRMLDGELSCKDGCGASDRAGTPDCTGNTGRSTWGLTDHPLAMVYAPLQCFGKLYDTDAALSAGTVFAELDLPFKGERVGKGGKC